MSSPLAFTVICAVVAFITVPSNFANPLLFVFGLMVFTMMGTAVSTTGTTTDGSCADAVEHDNPASTSAGRLNHAVLRISLLEKSFMGTLKFDLRKLLRIVRRDTQR